MMKSNKRTLLAFILLIFALAITPVISSMGQTKAAGYYIRVNKATNVVTIYNSSGTPVKAMICSTGNATPIGNFSLKEKYRWHELMGPCWGQYCTRYNTGMLFHSVYYWTNGNPSTQDWTAYSQLGTTASHGCIRLTTADAKWLYENCSSGTSVTIFWGSGSDDPLGKPALLQVSQGRWNGWDPTDPTAGNPWASAAPTITVKTNKIQYGSTFKYASTVAVYDSAGNDVTSSATVKIAKKINTKKLGKTYKVTYSITDALGRTASKVVTYKIVDTKKPILKGISSTKTKEYNTTANLRTKVTAKSYVGANLTSKIKIYYKLPGTSKYKFLSGSTLTLNHLGKYTIKYKVTNSKNKKTTTKYQTITVKDTKAPVIKGNTTAYIAKNTKVSLSTGVTAKLVSGKNVFNSLVVKITTPSKTTKTLTINSADKFYYTFGSYGKYTITYTATNSASKKTTTVTRTIYVIEPTTVSGATNTNFTATDSAKTFNVYTGVTATTNSTHTTLAASKIKVTAKAPNNATATITNGVLSPNQVGNYVLTYSSADSAYSFTPITRVVTVYDTMYIKATTNALPYASNNFDVTGYVAAHITATGAITGSHPTVALTFVSAQSAPAGSSTYSAVVPTGNNISVGVVGTKYKLTYSLPGTLDTYFVAPTSSFTLDFTASAFGISSVNNTVTPDVSGNTVTGDSVSGDSVSGNSIN